MSKHEDLIGILTPAEMDACTAATDMRAGGPIRELVHAVAEATGVSALSIYGRSRLGYVVRARQIVMLAAHERGMGLAQIGRALGRDHTTIMHGIKAEKARRSAGVK